jgi:hypothetical protein
MSAEIKEVCLTEEEKRSIRSERNIIIGFIIIITLVADAILLYVKKTEGGDFNNALMISSVMTLVIIILAVWIFIYKSRDLKSGTKLIIKGIISNKTVSQGKGSNHMIFINDERIFVLQEDYNKLHIGDEAEVHYTTRSKKVLHVNITKTQSAEILRNNRHDRKKLSKKAGKQ